MVTSGGATTPTRRCGAGPRSLATSPSPATTPATSSRSGSACLRSRAERKLHFEGGAAARGFLHLHPPAVRGHDRADDRQPKASAAAVAAAACVCPVEGLEDALAVAGRQARAVVGDREPGRAVLARDRDLDRRRGRRVHERVADQVCAPRGGGGG